MNTLTKKLLLLTAICLPFSYGNRTCAQEGNVIDNSIYSDLPFEMPIVEHPAFPDYTISIVAFGAQNDGKFLNTKAINEAIKAVHAKGGGKVVIPEGLWLTGPIELLSNVN